MVDIAIPITLRKGGDKPPPPPPPNGRSPCLSFSFILSLVEGQPAGQVKFTLMMKKGNKPQVRERERGCVEYSLISLKS